jgi:hypothetical protein
VARRRDHDWSVTAPPRSAASPCGYAARSEHSHVRAGDGVSHVVLLHIFAMNVIALVLYYALN